MERHQKDPFHLTFRHCIDYQVFRENIHPLHQLSLLSFEFCFAAYFLLEMLDI
jgi:hypothetical protein